MGEPTQRTIKANGISLNVAERHVERGAELAEQRSRRTALRPLHPPDHGPADAGARCKFVQRHARLRPQGLQATTDRAIEFLLVHGFIRTLPDTRTAPIRAGEA